MDYSTGELLLGLRYLRNRQDGSVQGLIGELLPGLPYLRNRLIWIPTFGQVNYYLDYRTSETGNFYFCGCHMVNYYLDYRTSETGRGRGGR